MGAVEKDFGIGHPPPSPRALPAWNSFLAQVGAPLKLSLPGHVPTLREDAVLFHKRAAAMESSQVVMCLRARRARAAYFAALRTLVPPLPSSTSRWLALPAAREENGTGGTTRSAWNTLS